MSDNRIFFAESGKYGFLALSVDKPRFCVAGATKDEARGKALEVLSAYDRNRLEIEAAKSEMSAQRRYTDLSWSEDERICA